MMIFSVVVLFFTGLNWVLFDENKCGSQGWMWPCLLCRLK